ncbi:hypothetical protein DEJ36_13990 [Curtobacterium sp. MCPF17_052]|nr:hypothetical protein [Curtobacterium sp. MCPF17_052]WIB11956.1 hypothetical protein DEJ36_13990 [Curtobacterium sp. MCPF17_052]
MPEDDRNDDDRAEAERLLRRQLDRLWVRQTLRTVLIEQSGGLDPTARVILRAVERLGGGPLDRRRGTHRTVAPGGQSADRGARRGRVRPHRPGPGRRPRGPARPGAGRTRPAGRARRAG